MKRVIYFDFWQAATEWYRLYPLDYINNPGLTIVRSTEQNVTWQLLDGFDTIVLSRPSHPLTLAIIKLAKQLHKQVIADFDDNVLIVDQFNPMYGHYVEAKKDIIDCLILCDEVWVTTAAIKQAFRLYNNNIHVIPNAHNDYIFPVSQKRKFTANKIATYRGGHSHLGDIYELGTPEKIISMVNNNPDWEFRFFGQRFEYLEKRCGDNYIAYSGNSDTEAFHRMMHDNNASVFFYPLANTPFNRSKSNCSWLEASYAGSAFFGNKDLPEFDKECIFSFDDYIVKVGDETMEKLNKLSWELICDTLLVSKVNLVREERLLA